MTLKSNSIINEPPYRLSPKMIEHVYKEIKNLLENKIIQRSSSKYSFPAFPIIKSNKRVRLIIDYRKLNAIIIKKSNVFITLTEILTQLHNSTVFSKIDLNLGYYQIPMSDRSIQFTAFLINNEKYESLRMPFCLTYAPRTFLMSMDKIFRSIPFVKVYIDDILIYSENESAHYEHLENILKLLHENNLSLNFDKSEFFLHEVKFLGHLISSNGIKPIIDKVEQLKKKTKK
ncbi:Transposon Ty3-I Gag-Pol polyprotein [Dictyocoela muelleri]|nr:Transposon Ty3-I Gag-Pol polyprotein [Dictyocoela muelleri]